MARFRFTLERVLQVRIAAELRARQGVAAATRALTAARAARDQLEVGLRQAEDAWRNARRGRVGLDREATFSAYAATLRIKLAQAEEELATAYAAYEDAMAQLTAARQRREILEKLKERRRREHEAFLAKLEQDMMDEIAQRVVVDGEMVVGGARLDRLPDRVRRHVAGDGGRRLHADADRAP